MGKIKYALGMLATGAVVGLATHAAATVSGPPVFTYTPSQDEIGAAHTQPFSYDVQIGTDFFGDPNTIFTYHGDGQANHLTSGSKLLFGTLAHFNSQVFFDSTLPSASETFDQTDITTWTKAPETALTADPWYHVEFIVPDGFGPFGVTGNTFLGTIQIDGQGRQELDQMLYTSAGVPEPAAWALMIMGFGAAGAALRKGRRALA